ncbi:Oxidoreductase molybdopterin binding domain-containing protein [Geodermatophilus obscurus]|uniref:Oxidoreductase molybdopterin binding domain-containing protein n=1 Tax=Geodermatophilus obscurus TaxID=1861 RepID=A0A1M7TSS2_9ACTN|nr:molybdopterin-dependent oxidoreductase [Geodermatophilus obscurus]SHN73663.1 Oxidoreductase molybdopterin binding domain-containing protein [Geodermatophilus obscurus]
MALTLPCRAGRRTNVGLLALLLLAGGTGVLAFAVGSPGPARLVVAAHGAAGLGLLLLVPWKAVVVRRSWRRPAGTRGSGGVSLGVATLLTLLTGVLHAGGGTGPWSWSAGVPVLHLHVALGVATGALLAVHAWGRRQRPRATDLDRRGLLRVGALGAGAVALWGAGEGLWRLTGAPGAARRATGSFERGTDDPAAMPVTQWIADPVPDSPADVLVLSAPGRQVRVPVADLDRGDVVRAALDCTGGWYAVQDWRGVRLDRLLASLDRELPADGAVDVVSVTGFRRRLPLSEAGGLLLATHAAGRPLSPGHGAPVRLVAPGRRGFWWVKWVARVEVVDAPWWLQSPFPLQ